jgi:hypothetical protein
MVIACAGYRVVGSGHHRTTFEALEISMGPSVSALVVYLDTCRRKRNQVDYDCANAATETEAEDLLRNVEEFRDLVEEWVRKHYPRYAV